MDKLPTIRRIPSDLWMEIAPILGKEKEPGTRGRPPAPFREVLDLMEEFRQQLADRPVLNLASKKAVTAKDFRVKEGFCRLSDEARHSLLKELLGKMEEYVSVGEEKMRWCDLLLSQARSVAQYLRRETGGYDGFYLRW